MNDEFALKTFGWQELAVLYAPGLKPHSASKRLSRWIMFNKKLHGRLVRSGWVKGAHVLSPMQVGIIVEYLGEPG